VSEPREPVPGENAGAFSDAHLQLNPVEVTKLQAEYVVPIMKAFQAELGAERANAIMRSALDPVRRAEAAFFLDQLEGMSLREKMRTGMDLFSRDDQLDLDVLRDTETDYDFNVRRCRWAEHFEELGEPDIGYQMCCNGDIVIGEHLPGVTLRRTQTIMEGAPYCDFRWHIEPDGDAGT
jgi:hypothetical protein